LGLLRLQHALAGLAVDLWRWRALPAALRVEVVVTIRCWLGWFAHGVCPSWGWLALEGLATGLPGLLARYWERLGVMSFARRSSPRSLSRRRRELAAVVNSARSSTPPAIISASACSQTTHSAAARRALA